MSGISRPDGPRGFGAAFILLFLCFGIAASLYQHQPPSPVSVSAPPEEFSAERAFRQLERIAREPHPIGSPACVAVREEIVRVVRELGLEPEVQRDDVHHIPGRAGTVHNVIARLPGERSIAAGAPQPGAVALMAHYDSVAFGPGASDDGSGVATLLETLRALKSQPLLQNDVVFLFTDAEEGRKHGGSGCRGSRAFVETHPWANDVAVVLNFDARGTGGPSYMYETSEENGWLIEQLAAAGCTPIASSCMSAAYRSMPVGSDLARFLDAGFAGLNFAFIRGLPQYHTALDTPANLDLRSLQQNGNCALGLTRRLGTVPLDNVRAPNRVYFNTVGYHLAHYPESWAAPLTSFALVLLGSILIAGMARKRISPLRVGIALVAFVLLAAISAGIGAAIGFGGYYVRNIYILYTSGRLTIAVVALTLLLFCALFPWLRRKLAVENLAAGGLLLWAALLAAVTWALPGATYLLLWPLLGMTFGLAVLLGMPTGGAGSRGVVILAVACASVPAILIWPGSLLAVHHCLMVIFSFLISAGVMLLLVLLVPLFGMLTARMYTALATAAAAVAIAGLAWAIAWPGFSAEQPRMNAVTYGLDTDTGQAFWMSSDAAPDKWTGQFITRDTPRTAIKEFIPTAPGTYLRDSAPPIAAPAPLLELRQDVTEGSVRRLTLHASSPRRAPILALYAVSDTDVIGGSIYGQPLRIPDEGPWYLINDILPPEGMELTLEVPAGRPVELLAVDHSYGLPDLEGEPVAARPIDCIPKPNTPDFNQEPLKTDETLVAKRYRF